jgi:hypothetical protein
VLPLVSVTVIHAIFRLGFNDPCKMELIGSAES